MGSNDLKFSENLNTLLTFVREQRPVFWRGIENTIAFDRDGFASAANPLVDWAADYLGSDFHVQLADGYAFLVMELAKSQAVYQKAGKYPNSSYDEVYEATYNNPEFMTNYHWGLYMATFAWPHHIKIFRFFEREFISKFGDESGLLLDLGSGSGVWSKLFISSNPNWRGLGVDISETSVNEANAMVSAMTSSSKIKYVLGDALDYSTDEPADAVISSFLLEHLENPRSLLENVSRNLKPKGFAFVTGALTAAEIDHISEFRYESELVILAEEPGLRVSECIQRLRQIYTKIIRYGSPEAHAGNMVAFCK
jgi:ubiquinone/menaquinone biosynthesis C-methylase UbiE